MAPSLLNFPPELLVHILAFLPIQALLKFGQTCKYSHSLANSSLHTLSLGIHPSRVAGIISKLAATQYPLPKATVSAFSVPEHPLSVSSSCRNGWSSRRSSIESDALSDDIFDDDDPYRVSVVIPDAQAFDYLTLLKFHEALTRTVLARHSATLRNLDLSLWTLTIPIAKAIASLSGLRALSIRIEDFPHVRSVPRSRIAVQRIEQAHAWTLLSKTAQWAPRLKALRIEGGELSTPQLARLLGKSRWCHELWLCRCSLISNDIWRWLGSEWEGRAALRILGVMRCGGRLDEEALDVIGGLHGLQVSKRWGVADTGMAGCSVADNR